MPPKKKKGGKKGKKKSAVKPTSDKAATIDDVLNEVTKEFYLLQIKDLEQKAARYQVKCDSLEILNKEVQGNFDQLSADKHEISSYLKKNLEEKSIEIIELKEKLSTSEGSRKNEEEKCFREINKIETEMIQMRDQLTSENMLLGGKLTSLEEFRLQREALTKKSEEMEERIKKQEEFYKEKIYHIERKTVVDNDKLKKEMLSRVNNVAAEFRQVSNKQMADTTKRAISENVTINSQLAKMSDTTLELIAENDEIKNNEKINRQNIEILEHNEKELMRKNATHKKLIMMLTEKSRDQEQCLDEYGLREKSFNELETKFKIVQTEFRVVKKSESSLKEERDNLLEKCQLFENEKDELFEDKSYLIGILADASYVIKHALQHNSEDEASMTEMKNTNLLQKVVEILNVAAEMGVGMNPEDLASAKNFHKMKKKKVYLGPLPTKNDTLYKEMYFSKPKAHYKLGDLGLVPPSSTSFHKKLLDNFQPEGPSKKHRQTKQLKIPTITVQQETVLKLPMLITQ